MKRTIHICDKCGKEFDPGVLNRIGFYSVRGSEMKLGIDVYVKNAETYGDICLSCVNILIKEYIHELQQSIHE